MRTLVFEDKGQDFIEWNINPDGVVLRSRPFQSQFWQGVIVMNPQVGQRPDVMLKTGEIRQLNYRITEIKE